MPKIICTHCGNPVKNAGVTVHISDQYKAEAPTGVFHVENDCFAKAVADHRRMIADAEAVIGVD